MSDDGQPEYPCLEKLAESVILPIGKLLEATDEEFRDLSKEIERNGVLQHAQLWLERRAAWCEKSDDGWETYSLEDLCRECDATMEEMLELNQPDFVRLSLEIVKNQVRCHATVAKEWNQRKQEQQEGAQPRTSRSRRATTRDAAASPVPSATNIFRATPTPEEIDGRKTPPPEMDGRESPTPLIFTKVGREPVREGGNFFCRHYDGIEYPVVVKGITCSVWCVVYWKDYGKQKLARVEMRTLLPVTKERKRIYKKMQMTRKEVEAQKLKAASKEKERKRKKREEEKLQMAGKKRQRLLEKAKKEEKEKVAKEKKELGPRTRIDNLPHFADKDPGDLVVQKNMKRRVYFANDNDTPTIISKKFDVPAAKIVYDNEKLYDKLNQGSKLKDWTRIVLPPQNSRKSKRGQLKRS